MSVRPARIIEPCHVRTDAEYNAEVENPRTNRQGAAGMPEILRSASGLQELSKGIMPVLNFDFPHYVAF
jgi:hypothetical protein